MPDDKQSHFISMMLGNVTKLLPFLGVPRALRPMWWGKARTSWLAAKWPWSRRNASRTNCSHFHSWFYFGYSCYFVSEIFVCCDRTCLPSMMRMKMAFCRSRRSSNTLKARYAVHLQSVFAGNKSGMNQCTSWFFPELEWIQVNLNSRLRSPAWQLDRVRVLPLPTAFGWWNLDTGRRL